MQGFLHHLDLTVADPQASLPFYDLFLKHAGFRMTRCDENTVEWGLEGRRYPSIGISRATGANAHRLHDRYAPGLHHFALAAASADAVDDLYDKLVAIGTEILDPPDAYPEYGEGYYAVFFADPDGLKLEYAYTPEPQEEMKAVR